MKRELTLTDIAGYLEHPLLGQHPSGNICWIDVEFVAKYGIALAGYKPVLRPMSDLYREITDKDYNGGKPFVPSIELAKLLDLDSYGGFYQSYKLISDRHCVEIYLWGELQFVFHANELQLERLSSKTYCSILLREYISIFDLLHLLMFDYRGLIDAGLAVSVYDLKRNPYEE